MHPDERANCGQVVQGLEVIFAKASRDENYCIRAVPGKLGRAAVDASTRPLSRLAFDSSSMQIIDEEDFLQLGISGSSIQEMQVSQEEVSPTHPHLFPADVPRHMQHPYSDIAVPDAQIAQEIAERSEAPSLGNRQERSWFYRLFCGCFA